MICPACPWPWEGALRVWDVLLFERNRAVLFQVALALIDENAKAIVDAAAAGDPGDCMEVRVGYHTIPRVVVFFSS